MFKLKVLKYLEKNDRLGLVSALQKEGLGHGTLTLLHQLVATELSSERFSHVQLVVRALEKLCENDKDLQTLLHSGLTSKLLWWYESVFEKLTCDLSHSPALRNLTAAFFDYFLELAKPSVPVSELRVILMYLCRTALDATVAFRLRLEAIRTFNSSLESCSPEQRRVLQAHHDIKCILSEMAAALFTAGDYELQASITETLCRLTLKGDRPIRARQWFIPELSHSFTAIRNPYFEADCRHFVNFLNRNHGDKRRVYTFPCLQAFLDFTQLSRPQDEDLGEFWIDFNLGSECVSFFLDDPNKETCSLWESIHVLRTEVNRYSLTERGGVSVLAMDLIKPILLENFRGQRLEIKFKADFHSELSRVVCRVFRKPAVPVSFMRTYRKKTPQKKLRVLPLSSPSSEEDSVVKSPERSRAEILFDQIQHSTPVYKCGALWEEGGHSCSSTSTELVGSIRKRPFPDSGYLSDHTSATPKRVHPSTESVRSPVQQKEAKEESVGLDAEKDSVFGVWLEPNAEEEVAELKGAESSAEEEPSLIDRAEAALEEAVGAGSMEEKVRSVEDGVGPVSDEVEPGAGPVSSEVEPGAGPGVDDAGPVSDRVGPGAGPVADEAGDGVGPVAEGAESHDESVAEESYVAGLESAIELVPANVKLEWSAEGATHLPERVELQVTKCAETLAFEQSEELSANTDIIASLKSQFEQQLRSQWQHVENQVVQFQAQTHKCMSELLSAFQEHRAAQVQMLESAVWDWTALEEFHAVSADITSFLKAENNRVMSFCRPHILRLKSAAMERACEEESSALQK